jgi:site-specific recombinase XerD
MFDQLFKSSSAIARHATAPYAQERIRYLSYCKQRGDAPTVVSTKASDLLWIVHRLSVYADLHLTIDQIRTAIIDRSDPDTTCHRKLDSPYTRKRLVDTTRAWLRYLGCLREPLEPIPFQARLDEYCDWARYERALSDRSIETFRSRIKQFLQWYGALGRPLSEVRLTDCDDYLAFASAKGWSRVTLANEIDALRAFFRYGAEHGWCQPRLAPALQRPRLYALESLPAGLAWTDVQRLFAALDLSHPRDIRARAILILLAIYGLRTSEVTRLCLEDIDWEHDQLRVLRAKRHPAQIYPLLPSLGNALIQYLQSVRPPSPHRQIFLTLISPYRPLSPGGLFNIVSARLKALEVPCVHHGPHTLRHSCARRLVAEGLSLKEIGDHLGHRSPSATRVYAKVDLPGLREVAAFDLGALS